MFVVGAAIGARAGLRPGLVQVLLVYCWLAWWDIGSASPGWRQDMLGRGEDLKEAEVVDKGTPALVVGHGRCE